MLLLSCSSTLGTCCTSTMMAKFLGVFKNIIDIIQIILPILLLVMLGIQFGKMMIDSENKKNNKQLFNKFIAAVIVFFIPVFVDVTLGLLPNSFQLSSCWEKASNGNFNSGSVKYVSENEDKLKKFIPNPNDYEEGNKTKPNNSTSNSEMEENGSYLGTGVSADFSIKGSTQGQEIVKYALEFVGAKYVRGRAWNGKKEDYRGTDCFNFVDGLYKHFGYDLNWHDISRGIGNYEYVSLDDIRAGDIAYYNGHGAMFTGNGEQIIHAMSPKLGVRLSSSYHGGGHLLHVVRVKGVN